MAEKKVVAESDITAQQMKEFWNQVALSKIDRCNLQSFLERGSSGQKEVLEKIQLEKENFRVETAGWQQHTNLQGITYSQNPEKDIWEYVAGVDKNLVGQQLFTWKSAMRETKKVGKRMPTNEEWDRLIDNDGFLKKEAEQFNLRGLFPGYRITDGAFHNLSSYAYFWSSSVSGSNAWHCDLNFSNSAAYRRFPHSHVHGFSVRCCRD
ncbi:MAG: FISUMP domain-containing protein [Patescibacteria group bacterium]